MWCIYIFVSARLSMFSCEKYPYKCTRMRFCCRSKVSRSSLKAGRSRWMRLSTANFYLTRRSWIWRRKKPWEIIQNLICSLRNLKVNWRPEAGLRITTTMTTPSTGLRARTEITRTVMRWVHRLRLKSNILPNFVVFLNRLSMRRSETIRDLSVLNFFFL